MKILLKTVLIFSVVLCNVSSWAQDCDCTTFPVEKRCAIICLKNADQKTLVHNYNLDTATAKKIVEIPNRRSFTKPSDFKNVLPAKTFQKLDSIYFAPIYIDASTTYNSNGNGPVQQGNNNTQNNTIVYYGKDDDEKPNTSSYTETFSPGIIVSIKRCTFKNYRLVCELTFENVSTLVSVQYQSRINQAQIVDDKGNVYYSNALRVGNVVAQKYAVLKYDLYKDTKVNVVIEFPVGNKDLKRISALQIIDGVSFSNIPVNTPLN